MEDKDRQELDLEDIIKEFHEEPEKTDVTEALPETQEPTPPAPVSGDTKPLPIIQITAAVERAEEKKEEEDTQTLLAAADALTQELSAQPVQEEVSEDPQSEETEVPAEPEPEPVKKVTGDTIRLDAIRTDPTIASRRKVRDAAPIEEEEELPAEPEKEPFTEQWEPEYEQPIGEYVPPQPIHFQPRSRLRELKRQLVAGPEKRYYALSEQRLGRLQLAIFLSLVVSLLCAGATVMYACGLVPPERQRLMVFGQFFGLLLSALFGCYQMMEGIADIFRGRFGPNTLLAVTFAVCCADGVFCLQSEQVPCCAAFSLQVTTSLWGAYQRKTSEIGQMDTMRKATRLDRISACPDYLDGRKGLLRSEGQVADFMDTYNKPYGPEKVLSWYCLAALAGAAALAVTAYLFYGLQTGIRVGAVSLLAALPATTFITISRPFGILQRQLHRLGTVLCGWQGVKGLCGKAVFPLSHEQLYPVQTVRLNGVKFFGKRMPDQIIAYTTAVVAAEGGGLTPLFNQLLDSRNGYHLEARELCSYDGGVGATVDQAQVLVGTQSFLKEMGVEVPEDMKMHYAVCVAIDGEFCGLYALNFDKLKNVAAGMTTLCAYHGLIPAVVTPDFMLTGRFLRSRFGIKPKKVRFPEQEVRAQLMQKQAPEDAPALLLTTADGLAPVAFGVTGARTLRTACILGVGVHMLGGIVGLAIMLALVLLQSLELLTPVNMFLYQLVWLVPGLLVSEWTRTI